MKNRVGSTLCTIFLVALMALSGVAQGADKKPNIVIIWGDDIGQSDISAYSHGIDGLQNAQH